ncbi:MAG: SDR family NAD(P)-dependent oxidoreductase [Deltaproteobacteria bacterium]|nr:SDR family NAD(P)-dependent oxidoreductase [Deltaproteobacteria bacterium]
MGLLNGKVAIITGAGGGIGREYALAFAKEGAKVVVNDVGGAVNGVGGDESPASKVCDEIGAAGGEGVPSFDTVATMEGGERIARTALDAFGKIDVLINNAGILRDKTFAKMEESDWDAVMAVHLKGAFCCTKPVFRHMRERNEGGRIVNVSSLAGLIGNFGQSNYGSAKAGIAGFTRVLSVEGQKYNITCNAIAPVALTRMTETLPMFQGPGIEKMLGPEWIAPLAVYLASDLSAGVTGKIFGVQGGKVFEYKMVTTEGVTKDRPWTAEEIAKELPNITHL